MASEKPFPVSGLVEPLPLPAVENLDRLRDDPAAAHRLQQAVAQSYLELNGEFESGTRLDDHRVEVLQNGLLAALELCDAG